MLPASTLTRVSEEELAKYHKHAGDYPPDADA